MCPKQQQTLTTLKHKGKGWQGGTLLLRNKRNKLARDKAIAYLEHATSKSLDDWFTGEMKVSKHFVRVPMAKKLHGASVDIGQKESHRLGSTE